MRNPWKRKARMLQGGTQERFPPMSEAEVLGALAVGDENAQLRVVVHLLRAKQYAAQVAVARAVPDGARDVAVLADRAAELRALMEFENDLLAAVGQANEMARG